MKTLIKYSFILTLLISSAWSVEFRSAEFSADVNNLRLQKEMSHRDIVRALNSRFSNFLAKTGTVEPFHVHFLDTENRLLKSEYLVLRVRKNLDRPKRSSVTIKRRTTDRQLMETLALEEKHFSSYKYEIDQKGESVSFSASYNIKFNSKKHFKKVNGKTFNKFTKRKVPYINELLNNIYNVKDLDDHNKVLRLKVPLTYVGSISQLRGIDFDFEVWFFPYSLPNYSISFKVEGKDHQKYLPLYKELLIESKLELGDPEDPTKTGRYWLE